MAVARRGRARDDHRGDAGLAGSRDPVPTLFRTIVYSVGGWVGSFTGVTICSVLIRYEARDFDVSNFHFVYALVVTAFLSALLGLTFHHNRKRNDRLVATMERLKEHEFAEKELQIAREMQERLLPPGKIEKDGYRIDARTHAAHIVGGDFYDVIQLADDAIAVLAADVCREKESPRACSWRHAKRRCRFWRRLAAPPM